MTHGKRTIADLPGPRGMAFLLEAVAFRPSALHLAIERWCARYGPVFTMAIPGRRAVVFSDPDVIARALRERPAVYRRIGLIEDVFEEMGINGVFSAEGEAWRAQRRTVAAALDAKHVRAFFPTLARVTRRLERRWLAAAARDEPTDVLREAMLYTVDVTTNLAFGYDMNTLEEPAAPIQHDLERLFPMINRRIALPYPYWRHVRLPADRALDRSLVALRARIDGMVAETRERVASSGTAGPRERNFLESAVTQAPGAPELSSRDIFANVVNLLLGGEDTTASTLAWALHYIGERPAVAARLAAEADDVLGAADVVPRIEDVARLRYHDAVVIADAPLAARRARPRARGQRRDRARRRRAATRDGRVAPAAAKRARRAPLSARARLRARALARGCAAAGDVRVRRGPAPVPRAQSRARRARGCAVDDFEELRGRARRRSPESHRELRAHDVSEEPPAAATRASARPVIQTARHCAAATDSAEAEA